MADQPCSVIQIHEDSAFGIMHPTWLGYWLVFVEGERHGPYLTEEEALIQANCLQEAHS